MAKVFGTQRKKPELVEYGVDTVYIRENIVQKTNADNQLYWEYDEKQYTYPEYAKIQQRQIDDVMLAQVEIAAIVRGGNNG